MGDAPPDLIFVYGSLRKGSGNRWAEQLAAASDWIGEGSVRGMLFAVDGFPALQLDPRGGYVTGDLFRMRDPSATLALLDEYEDCAPQSPHPHPYRRIAAPVATDEHARLAWLYVVATARPT